MSIDFVSQREWLIDDRTPGFAEAERMLLQAVRLERLGYPMRVGFTIHATEVRGGSPPSGRGAPGAVSLYRDHGQRPALVWNEVEGGGGFEGALRHLANRRARAEVGGEITRIELHVWEE